jgi:hypothetical protein
MLKPLLLLAGMSTAALALDVVGEAPYLENKYRAAWHAAPLSTVLKDVEKQCAPLATTHTIDNLADKLEITVIDRTRVRMRDTLELLERTQELRFTAEPLKLTVETWTDYRNRKRRLVNLALRDYGLFLNPPDFFAPNLGYDNASGNGGGGGGFSLFAADTGDNHAGRGPDPSEVVDWLRSLAGDADATLRGNGNLHVMITAEEETAIRAALTEQQQRLLQRTAWSVTYGTLPAGQQLSTTGMCTLAEAQALRPRLQTPRRLTVSAMNGQRVHAIDGHQQALIDDLDVVNYQFDPKTSVLTTGVAMELRPVIGTEFIHLSYLLSWVDPLPSSSTELINPARVRAGSTSTTTTTTTTDLPPEAGKPPKPGDPPRREEKTTTSTTTSDGGDLRPGVSVVVSKPVLWTWKPRGETMLPKDRALIFASEHPAGTAVMILEALP